MLKEPLHRRFRIIFIFDKPITTEKHYRYILLQLAKRFPIIPEVSRSPAQPVFGNGREDFNFHICGNILKLQDYPLPKEPERIHQEQFNVSETLEDFLRRHRIGYTVSKDPGKYFLTECPFRAGHTDGKQGKTDTYVFDDGTGWAFYCSHAHCADKRTWEAFKKGHNINGGNGNGYQKKKKNGNGNYVSDPPPTEDQIEQSDEEPKTVKFPEDMFYGIFETYRNSVEGRTPVP